MFKAKTWTNRVTEFPTRRILTKEDGSSEIVTVARAEGNVSSEGDAFNAENMNDLENRITSEFNTLDKLKWQSMFLSGNITNMNDLPRNSVAYFYQTTQNIPHIGYGIAITLGANDVYKLQLAVEVSNAYFAHRVCNNNVWSTWRKI